MPRTRVFFSVILALTFGLVCAGEVCAASKDVKIGDRIANLTFKDTRYLPRSLDDFPDKKAFVLVFTNTSCPLVQRYLPVLKQMEKTYRDKGVQFLAVNVGAEDSIVAMASQMVRHEMEFPFVKDFEGECLEALEVRRTPETVVLDGQRTLRYRGRIDDQYRLGGTRAAATRHDLQEAIDAVLAGREVAVKETPVDGCLITRPETPPTSKSATFAEDVAPILQRHCQECHRPNTAAPFALLTYKQVAVRADAIAEAVTDGRMPPWYASDDYGHFINKRGLTTAERDTLLQWVRSGKPLGDVSKLPKAALAAEGQGKWSIGKPDLELKAPRHQLPASGDIPYKYVVLPYIFLDDTWVQGVQILPDNPRVLHHCNMAYLTPGDGYKQANFITGTVPGGDPMRLSDGVGFRIPKGASLALQIHYVTTGKEEKCQIAVGFRYAQGIIQKQLQHKLLVDNKFAIPPGAPAHPVSASKVFEHDAIGLGLFVHMHLRGRDMLFRAHKPDGTTETLLLVPNYSFDWQMPYVWESGKMRFPKGTRLECVAHYDNSAFNPYNPDPATTVRDGPQTHHEMMNGFVFYTDAGEQLNLKIDPKTGRVCSQEKK
jgi:thiol-disulfide isomerase/thioredoxin